ncbi:MAG: phosphatidylglycerophosphatase A [Candidatus Aminicenantes bacterium]|nr:phosphatidylglycerophosphatase A [Candidatus Aminicenantes bacterium]
MKFLSKVVSTFFGIGFIPFAPGTLTSMGIVLLYKYYLYRLSWPLYALILILLFFIGVYASTKYSTALNKKDPRKIVIDEALGQLLVLFRMSNAWFPVLSCFVLFRVFDIAKPFPIKKIEALPTGWGIMLDDVVAAVYAGVIVNLYLLLK